MKGRTRKYIPVRLKSPDDIIEYKARLRLGEHDEKGMTADVEDIVKG